MASRPRALAALTLILTQLTPLATVLSQGAVPDVEVEAIAPDKVGECLPANFTVRAGDEARIVVEVVNRGNGTYSGPVVDLLPRGWVLAPDSVTVGGGQADVAVEGQRIICNVTLGPGQSLRITYTVTVWDQGCNRVTAGGEGAACCVSLVPVTLTLSPIFLLLLGFLPIRSRPVVVDKNSLKDLISALGEGRISKRWKLHVSRRTVSDLLTDPEVGGSVERLVSTGVLKVQDPTADREVDRLVLGLVRQLGLDRDEAEALALAMGMNAKALITSSEALRKAGAEASLDAMTPREFLEEMVFRGTLSDREWDSALRRSS